MSFNALSGCMRCRITSQLRRNADSWLRPSLTNALPNFNYSTRRHRTDKAGKSKPKQSKHAAYNSRSVTPVAPGLIYRPPRVDDSRPGIDAREHLKSFFVKRAKMFVAQNPTHDRLQAFGLSPKDARILLGAFRDAVQSGYFSTEDNFVYYGLTRLSEEQATGDDYAALAHGDRVLTHAMYKWASGPSVQEELKERHGISKNGADSIARLYEAADKSNLAEQFIDARRLRRKVIMHVGPTNSGKTFNALRALAAAKRGVYAGPLRLLAHEIWERLNLGEIPPLGVEIPKIADGKDRGNPAHARLTNMITGEEQKIVSDEAPLLTCTVEMLSTATRFDVAVVDEIQMIADPERGGGWTTAVLGLCADELHLCGEETAVPLVEAMLKTTGDELIINRYERLTPLAVEDKALGDITNVQPGDCIVTFSRKNIFSLKNRIQEQTGMKCVVAYGMLPPEIRSEQAALFNDPDSGYDIMIGSDAIGMGLNLKIKRVIFEKASKFNGRSAIPLSISQVKQIAGRAGRFGQHSSGGLVTALHPADLDYVRKTLQKSVSPLTHARVNVTTDDIAHIATALPPNVQTQALFEAHSYVGNLDYGQSAGLTGSGVYKFQEMNKMTEMAEVLDSVGPAFTLRDRSSIVTAPVPWADEEGVHVVRNILLSKMDDMAVSLEATFDGAEMVQALSGAEEAIAQSAAAQESGAAPPPIDVEVIQKSLKSLEKLHKNLVLYLWLSYRNPVTYYDYEVAMALKERVEVALDWCLWTLSAEEEKNKAAMREEKKGIRKKRIEYKDGFMKQNKRELEDSTAALTA